MSEYDDLLLDRFAQYIRREQGLCAALWGLVGGLAAALLMNVVAWTFPVLALVPRLAASMGVTALACLLAFVVAYLYPRSPTAIARQSDARMRLRARLATAVEIQEGRLPVPDEIATRQRSDARAAAERADPAQAFAPTLPRRQALIAAVLMTLLVVGAVVPNPQERRIAQRQAEQEVIAEQVERLERVRQEITENEGLSEEDKQALLRELDDTIRDLEGGELSREEALARLSETEGKLQELLEDTDLQRRSLREAGTEAELGTNTRELGEALAGDDYGAAVEALASLAEQLPQMAPQELASTAERLEAMAASLEGASPELAQALRDAAEAMRRGDIDAAQEALRQAGAQMREIGQRIEAQEATERALAQIQEGRREIAQSGQPQGSQQGEGQQGQSGQGQGQEGQGGQGQGQQSTGSSGSGSGDADGEGGEGPPQDPAGPIQPNQPGQEGQTSYDPVYDPERLGEGGGEGEQVEIPGEGEGGPATGESEGTPPEEGEALVPYNEVYTDYQAQAASALESSYIPRGLKAYVRAYFSALEPGR
jgi:hypothetical protein